MNKASKHFLLSILILLGINACTDDYFDFEDIGAGEWRPELAIPLVNSTLDLEDILIRDTNELISVDPNSGVLEIIYEGSIFSQLGNTIVDLPSQTFNGRISGIRIPSVSPPVIVDSSYTINFSSTIEIDSVLLKTGLLSLNVESTYQHDIDLRFEFPSVRNQSGQRLLILQTLNASNGSSPTVANVSRSLENYTVDMTEGGSSINRIPIQVRMTINPIQGNPSSSADEMVFRGRIESLDYRKFAGYIGQESLQLEEDTVRVNLFKNFKAGVFFVSNPKLEIDIRNSFGLPVNLDFQTLRALNPDQSGANFIDMDLPTDPITNQKNLRRLNSPTAYGIANTDIDLNNLNSNIDEIISFLVEEIVYESRADFNPEGKTQRNFITDTSGIGLDVFLKIPFEGRVKGFSLVDTIDLNFEVVDDVDNGTIRLIAENSFPVETTLQLYFLDSLFNPIDSLYEMGAAVTIPAANIDANGDAIGSVRKITDAQINRERLEKLENGRFAIIAAELNTSEVSQGRNVRFKEDHRLQVAVGLKAEILID